MWTSLHRQAKSVAGDLIARPEEKAEFLATHFWNKFNIPAFRKRGMGDGDTGGWSIN